MDLLVFILFVAAAIAIYVLPAYIAAHRNHHQFYAITALNLLLGWTFLFWVAALVWALTATSSKSATA